MSYMIDKMSSGRNCYKQRSAEENCCNRDRTAPPYHRDLRGRFWHWGRRCCNLGRSSGWFFYWQRAIPATTTVWTTWFMKQNPVVRITSIRGVVKNLVRDTDPVEWDSCSISPDLIKIYQQKASAFHRNVMGRGLFALRRRLLKKEKSILHSENGGYRSFDIIVYNLILFYHGYIWDSIEIIINVSHLTLKKHREGRIVFVSCPVLYNNSSCKRRLRK